MTREKANLIISLQLALCLFTQTSKALEVFPKLSPTAGSILQPSEFTDEADVKCIHDSRLLEMAAGNETWWAWRMMDASAEVQGVLSGARFHLGSFDSCVYLKEAPIKSQYCLVEMTLPPAEPDSSPVPTWDDFNQIDLYQNARLPLQGAGVKPGWRYPGKILVALCVPASCRNGLLQRALEQSVNGTVRIVVEENQCVRDEERKWSFWSTIFWLLIGSLSALTFWAGLADKTDGWLSAWNCRRHWNVLSNPEPPLKGMDLSALSGFRAIMASIAVIIHRGFNAQRLLQEYANSQCRYLQLKGAFPEANLVVTGEIYSSLLISPFANGAMAMNFLFLYSGLFMALKVDSSSSFGKSAILRYLRLTPPYLMVMFMYGAVLETMGRGPLWNSVIGRESQACRKWWWSNALYVNNFVHGNPEENSCMLQSWSLAVDMQLFLVASWLLLRFHGRHWVWWLLLGFSTLLLFVLTLVMDWPALMIWSPETLENPFADPIFYQRYIPSYLHITPYVMGVMLGAHMSSWKSQGKEINASTTHVLTVGGFLLTGLTMSSGVIWYKSDAANGSISAALYAALTPIVYTSGHVAMVIAFIFGTKTATRKILSWQPLVSIARLSYGVCLVEFGVQLVQAGAQRTAMHISALSLVMNSVGDLAVCWILSLALYFLVEAPVRDISKKIFGERRSSHITQVKLQASNGVASEKNSNEKTHLH